MLTIVIGLILLIGLMYLVFNLCFSDFGAKLIATLGSIIFCASIAIGLFAPISGTTDLELEQEIELVSLSNSIQTEGSGLFYVSLSADNTYTYRYEIDSALGTETSKEYKTSTISGNVIEIEDPNCDKPVLKIYESHGEKSVWTFALDSSVHQYIFYVPEGTIIKEVKLN